MLSGSTVGPQTEGGGGPVDLPPRSPAFLLESAIDNRRISRPRARKHAHAFESQTQMRSLIFSCKWETRGDFSVCVEECGLALFAPTFLLVNGSGRISAPQESSLHSAALWYISGFHSLARNKLRLNSQALIRCDQRLILQILQLRTLQAPMFARRRA